MRPIDVDQVRFACREAVGQMMATAGNPDTDLSPAERRHLQAVAKAILILISEPAPQHRDVQPLPAPMEASP